MPAAIETVEILFGEIFPKKLQYISLSNDIIGRQFGDMADGGQHQLFAKLRGKLFSIQLD